VSEPYTLTIGAEDGAPCAKCSKLIEQGARKRNPATWTLAQGQVHWFLCGDHAALAAHTFQIPTRCFTPHLINTEAQHGTPEEQPTTP
jgi:hypothetical protein